MLHDWVLQDWELAPEQEAPPPDGEGLVQVRLWMPPPQVAEQLLKSVHPPFTTVPVAEQMGTRSNTCN